MKEETRKVFIADDGVPFFTKEDALKRDAESDLLDLLENTITNGMTRNEINSFIMNHVDVVFEILSRLREARVHGLKDSVVEDTCSEIKRLIENEFRDKGAQVSVCDFLVTHKSQIVELYKQLKVDK